MLFFNGIIVQCPTWFQHLSAGLLRALLGQVLNFRKGSTRPHEALEECASKTPPRRCWHKEIPETGRWTAGNLQPSPMKGKENDLNQTSRESCSMLIFKGVITLKLTAKAPENGDCWKMFVSFWGPAHLQGRTVSFREGISCAKMEHSTYITHRLVKETYYTLPQLQKLRCPLTRNHFKGKGSSSNHPFLRCELLVLGKVSHMTVWNVYSKIEI